MEDADYVTLGRGEKSSLDADSGSSVIGGEITKAKLDSPTVELSTKVSVTRQIYIIVNPFPHSVAYMLFFRS